MGFDFYQQFKSYSTIELLKIIKRPSDYQPDAVAIATEILSQRQITPDEILFVDNYYLDIENDRKADKEKIEAYKNKATDFLQPILHPTEKIEPYKWLNIFLLVIAVQYAWDLFKTAKRLIVFLQCEYCRLDTIFWITQLTLIYVPVIFYLLYKRKRWGWILLFADNLFTLLSGISQSYIFFKYQSIHHGDTTSFLFPIFIRAAFALFLWRDSIATHFGVSNDTKKKTAIITTIITLFLILLLNILFL